MKINFNIFNKEPARVVELAEPRTSIKGELFKSVGAPGESLLNSFNKEERRTDDLKISDYRKMKDNDGQVQMLLNAIYNTILSAGIDIVDDEDIESEEESEEKKFIEKNLLKSPNKGGLRKDYDFEYTTRVMLRAFEEGFRLFEAVYRVGEDGKYELDYLAPRAGKDGDEVIITVDDNGHFKGFKQRTHINGRYIDITLENETEINKVIKTTYGREYGSLYGRSGLRAAWYHYDKIHRLLFLTATGVELGSVKFRHFKMVGRLPDDKQVGILGAMQKIGAEASMLYSQQDGELVFEDVSDANVIAEGLNLIDRHYSLMAKSLLAQFIELGSKSAETGSRSLGESQTKFFKEGLQAMARVLIEETWNTVIDDLIKINFGTDVYPRLKVKPIDDRASELILTAFQEMIKVGKVSDETSMQIEESGAEKLELDVTREQIEKSNQEKQQKEQDQMKVDAQIKKQTVKLSEEGRSLYPDEMKVDFEKIRSYIANTEVDMDRQLTDAYNRQKAEVIEKYIQALRTGKVDKVTVNLADVESYGEKLRAWFFNIHQFGKVEAANEIGVGAPVTNKIERASLLFKVDSIIKKQESDMEFRASNVVNQFLYKEVAESEVRYVIEQDLTAFFDSIKEATISQAIYENLNKGRLYTFEQNQKSIFAYRYSAVIDNRTTDYCRSLDGRVFQRTDPNFIMLTPPNHWRCRSIWVAIPNTMSQDVTVNGKPSDVEVFSSINTFR